MDALENLVLRYLGHRYQGRRYLRYAELRELGIVANRATLRLWMEAGAFPRGIKIAGPYGHTLLWLVSEVVQVLADRAADRTASAETEEGASLSQGRALFLIPTTPTARCQRATIMRKPSNAYSH